MRKKFMTRTAIVISMAMLLNNCAATPENCVTGQNTVATGALIGGGVGALAGGIAAAASRQNGGAAAAIVLGAALVGAAVGAAVAHQHDLACHQLALQQSLDLAMARNVELQQQQDAANQAAAQQAAQHKAVKKTKVAAEPPPPAYTTIAWADKMTNNSGTITPVADVSDTASNQVCMSFNDTQTIDGQTKTVLGKACRDSKGDWKPT